MARMKVRLAASFLAIILFTSATAVFFSPTQADAKADISVAMKAKKKVTLLAIQNNSDSPIYSFEIKALDGGIRSVKVKQWDREKIDYNIVMIRTDDKPITKGSKMIVLLILEKKDSALAWQAFGINEITHSATLLNRGTIGEQEIKPSWACSGTAACFTGSVLRIVDGDTLDVSSDGNTVRIRLALTNTPEKGQPLYNQAAQFTASLCSVGSIAGIDEDDGQREGSYDRMIAKVFCSNKILNAELLYAALAVVDQRFCNESEFANEGWAQQYGCKQTVQQTQPQPPSVTPSPPPPKEERNCDPSYPDVCIPPPPPDLDCDEIPYKNFRVLPPDPHGFDRDKDGIGCET